MHLLACASVGRWGRCEACVVCADCNAVGLHLHWPRASGSTAPLPSLCDTGFPGVYPRAVWQAKGQRCSPPGSGCMRRALPALWVYLHQSGVVVGAVQEHQVLPACGVNFGLHAILLAGTLCRPIVVGDYMHIQWLAMCVLHIACTAICVYCTCLHAADTACGTEPLSGAIQPK